MPHSQTLPTPSNPSASGITYFATTTISAPASLVWAALLDFPRYPEWNSFTTRVTFPNNNNDPHRPPLPRVGDTGDLDARIASPTAAPNVTKVVVSVVDVPTTADVDVDVDLTPGVKYRLCWKAQGYPTWSLRPERVMEVEVLEVGEGEDGRERDWCEFRTWETMAGPLAGVVRRVVGVGLDGAFGRVVGDLKGWVEGGMGRGEGEGEGEGVSGDGGEGVSE
ncbi:hypothetical protein MMC20_006617 [Loxospora ochrophaea]|nr:hypothetical protein [Loxospora ochrophaea]